MTDDYARGYLSAMIDREGTVSVYRKTNRTARVSNTEVELIDAMCTCLDHFDIGYNRYESSTPKGRPFFHVHVGRRAELLKLIEATSCASLRKQQGFTDIAQSYAKAGVSL